MIAKNIGLKLLGIWLILTGILPFLNLHVRGVGTVLAIIALFAGILILIGR